MMLLERRPAPAAALADPFARRIRYLRVSLTDRCDLRCVYCMSERMRFAPDALALEDLHRLCAAFIDLGVRKIRLTGGEPLVRPGMIAFARGLGARLGRGLEELTLTTNGSRLARHAGELAALGMRRINVSLDSLDPHAYARITRGGDLAKVLEGLEAAQSAGLAVKLNVVALKNHNAGEIPAIIAWAHGRAMDVSLIEVMPMGETGEDRREQFLSLAVVQAELAQRWRLTPIPHDTGGPSRYVRVAETGGRLGFITPLSHRFCESCNRVRLAANGALHLCLGQNAGVDLGAVLRSGGDVPAAIRAAIGLKPERHDFAEARLDRPALARRMSETGG